MTACAKRDPLAVHRSVSQTNSATTPIVFGGFTRKEPSQKRCGRLFQEIMTRIVQGLHDLREPSATTVIEDLKEYIARITTNFRNDVLRTKSPSHPNMSHSTVPTVRH